VLRAGAVCLPVSLDLPTERVRYMLADVAPSVLLTRAVDAELIPAGGYARLLLEHLEVAAEPSRPAQQIRADVAAYVLCPAGSEPVALTHANVLARLGAGNDCDRVITGIWRSLVAGERVVIDRHHRPHRVDPDAGLRAYVLDGSLRPVPPGTEGELYVGGAQVARGFHRRFAATAGRFVADPFMQEATGNGAGARMYRTGERVRQVDGRIVRPDREAAGSGLARWRRALQGVGSPSPVPTDRMAGGGDTAWPGSAIEFSIGAAQHQAALRVARGEGATLFTVLRATLAVLLARMGVHRDIVIGGEAGQAHHEVNTLALRARVAPEMPFSAVLAQVRDFDVAAFENADVPFEALADLLGGRRPQVALALAPTTRKQTATSPFDLAFTYSECWTGRDPAGMDAVITYNGALFDAETVRSLAALFADLLASVTDTPEAQVGSIALSPGPPLDGGTPSEPRTLADILTGTAATYPDAPALTDGAVTLTYRELDARSDALARALIGKGAAPGRVVALGLPRSVDFMIALWAVTKTGAAYLPVDPTHPAERLERVLTEAGVQVGVGEMAVGAGIAWTPVTAGDRLEGSGLEGAGPVRVPVSVDELAYIIYTSGSTGTPKGVMVSHRGLSTLAEDGVRRYRVTPQSRVAHGYNPTFDAALHEMLLAFGSGACLAVIPADVYAGPDLHRVLVERGVTHYLSTPAVLTSLDPHGLEHLEVVAVGGEALSTELAATWSKGRLMLNAYGPTESTVAATITEVAGQVTIGSPIPGTTALVLDDRLRHVPVGGIGELYLCGTGLARGYVGDQGRTATRFVAHASGARMYRTGDLVHRRADGNLHFIARVDRQVKIRGVRIEPGEVDAAIKRLADVDGALTLPRSGAAGADALVSYVVPRGALDVDVLRTRLEDALPSYLVPAAIVVLDAFPLNTSGKVDAKALPAPVIETHAFRAPESAVEQTVAAVFAEVLHVEHVGLDDDFFALGGNSLIATQLAARLGAALDAHVPVRLLFEASTVAALAERVASEVGASRRVPLAPRVRPERIPLSLAQQRMWFLSRFAPESPAYNIPVAVRLTGDLDVDALQAAVRDVLDRHESLRTVFPEIDGEPVQVVLPADRVDLDLTPTAVAADAVDGHVLSVVARGFDVTTAVPLRGRLLQVSEHEFVLVIVVHHNSGDGFSTVPLARDVMMAYAARSTGNSPAWAPLPVQYADFALWQREILGSEDNPQSLAARQLDYWTHKLAGIPEMLELPTDRPRPANPTNRGASLPVTIDAATHARLAALAQQHNTTLFMVVHAALAVLLARVTETSDIVIGTPVAGRGERELDDLVGMFVNTLVLRTEVEATAPLSDVLGHVRETDLSAIAYSDVPFERLVEIMNPARSQSYSALFQVLLAFQNQTDAVLELPGLTIAPLDLDVGATKFDLDVTLSDTYDQEGAAAGITGALTYATELFDPASAARLAEMLKRVLDAFVTDPAVLVGDVPLTTEAEQARILRTWNATDVDVRPETLVDLLDAQA
ncbi:MAG: amino acid adenylation domain-containing protein, partial [Rhodococcus sp. (in: high G+C Gram-positive bacteria)]|uniref:amino acid adenylation domain-containing protein n=1 Tax=Rhodococcus sp. TaxID=1831 RepID=UPI003BB0D2C6